MDKKEAYEILGISPKASLEEAKKAFRDLAKKYHPDLSGDGTDHMSESRMKEVNIAYRLLVRQLKPGGSGEERKETQSEKPDKKDDRSVADLFKSVFERFSSAIRESGTSDGRKSQPRSHKTRPGEKTDFDQILKSFTGKDSKINFDNNAAGGVAGRFRRTDTQRFQDYLKIKKKYRSRTGKRYGSIAVDAIGPVEPVSPVKPVAKD